MAYLGLRKVYCAKEMLRNCYRVQKDGCWIWAGAKSGAGYGLVRGPRPLRKVSVAHRLSYEYHIGPIPIGMEIDHLCRHKACVNPDHLQPVPHRVNIQRAKGITNDPWGPWDFPQDRAAFDAVTNSLLERVLP